MDDDQIRICLHGHKLGNGDIVLELRKKFVIGKSNGELIKHLVLASLSSKPVRAKVLLEFRDKLLARAFWLKERPDWFENNNDNK